MRVTDSSLSSSKSLINAQRLRIGVLQERMATGKRINRPSDDPAGAEAVIRLRTTQGEIEQFRRNTETVDQKLNTADDSMGSYEQVLDRLRSLVSKGNSDTTTQEQKNILATEIDGLRERILNIANSRNGDEYLFGGTRQNTPPFDPTNAAPAATPTVQQFVQVEPGANAVATGVTAEMLFSDANGNIFADLTTISAALRGTGDPAADRAALTNGAQRLKGYTDLAAVAHAKIGAYMKNTEMAAERLGSSFLSLEEQASKIETADFVETAVQLTQNQQTLEATLQMTARGRRSLIDFLG